MLAVHAGAMLFQRTLGRRVVLAPQTGIAHAAFVGEMAHPALDAGKGAWTARTRIRARDVVPHRVRPGVRRALEFHCGIALEPRMPLSDVLKELAGPVANRVIAVWAAVVVELGAATQMLAQK